MSAKPHPARVEPAPERAEVRPLRADRRFTSAELLGERRRLEIDHRGLTYRLQITRLGKRILTK